MSRERFARSRYDWHCETRSSRCSYSEMFMTTVVARPFCVMNRGRCVRFVRSRQSLNVRRYSVKGMTSSLILGRGKVFSTNGDALEQLVDAPERLGVLLLPGKVFQGSRENPG